MTVHDRIRIGLTAALFLLGITARIVVGDGVIYITLLGCAMFASGILVSESTQRRIINAARKQAEQIERENNEQA